mgnify:CR=1 FL=1
MSFDGKVAIITGAGGGLGKEHALLLADLGVKIVVNDLGGSVDGAGKGDAADRVVEEIRAAGGQAVANKDSVSDREGAKRIVETAIKEYGTVDILINNAAINPTASSLVGSVRTTRLENFSLDRWTKELNVGLTGAFLCSKVFGTAMASDGRGGVILNIASDLSVIAPDQNLYRQEGLDDTLQAVKPITYSVIKTGLVGLREH